MASSGAVGGGRWMALVMVALVGGFWIGGPGATDAAPPGNNSSSPLQPRAGWDEETEWCKAFGKDETCFVDFLEERDDLNVYTSNSLMRHGSRWEFTMEQKKCCDEGGRERCDLGAWWKLRKADFEAAFEHCAGAKKIGRAGREESEWCKAFPKDETCFVDFLEKRDETRDYSEFKALKRGTRREFISEQRKCCANEGQEKCSLVGWFLLKRTDYDDSLKECSGAVPACVIVAAQTALLYATIFLTLIF